LPTQEDVKIKIYNLLGEEVFAQENKLSAGVHYLDLNLASLPNGIYFVKVQVGNKEQTEKLILDK
jgi:hypothetical protein